MTVILVNAASAKFGGARTILDSFVSSVGQDSRNDYVVIAGYESASAVPQNVTWIFNPKGGVWAVLYSLFGVFLTFIRCQADCLISFNNVNCVFLGKSKKITYFHQPKALDKSLKEPKLFVYRAYFRFFEEPVVVQSPQVKKDFHYMFSEVADEVEVIWPGIDIPIRKGCVTKADRHVLVPVASPQSGQKNFDFVMQVARILGPAWRFSVTAEQGSVNLEDLDNIELVGFKSRDELFDLYYSATCVLMPSTHETVGLPIFEALSAGATVVAYDAEYIRSFRDWFGITEGLILSPDPDDAAEKIHRCQLETIKVCSNRDFREGEWYKIFDMIKGAV